MKQNLVPWGVFAAFVACAIGFGWHAAMFRFDGPMGAALQRAFPFIDVVVRGEGEPELAELMRDLLGGGEVLSVVRRRYVIHRERAREVQTE